MIMDIYLRMDQAYTIYLQLLTNFPVTYKKQKRKRNQINHIEKKHWSVRL